MIYEATLVKHVVTITVQLIQNAAEPTNCVASPCSLFSQAEKVTSRQFSSCSIAFCSAASKQEMHFEMIRTFTIVWDSSNEKCFLGKKILGIKDKKASATRSYKGMRPDSCNCSSEKNECWKENQQRAPCKNWFHVKVAEKHHVFAVKKSKNTV